MQPQDWHEVPTFAGVVKDLGYPQLPTPGPIDKRTNHKAWRLTNRVWTVLSSNNDKPAVIGGITVTPVNAEGYK
jgi:hypothetical protein